MDGFIDDNLKNLTSVLNEIIKFVNIKKIANENNQDLFIFINDFYNIIKDKEIDVLKYDFKNLRRKINKLIHPDLNLEYAKEANELVTKINANIDNIIEFQKDMLDKGVSSYNWSVKSNPKYEYQELKDKYKTYYSGDLSKERNPIYGYQTVGDNIKETWNYVINKVPRDANDYYRIKENYETLIRRVKEKIQNKQEIIKKYEDEIRDLKDELVLNLKEENIDEIFLEEKKTMTDAHNSVIDKYEIECQKLDKIKQPINEKVHEKCAQMKKIYDDYQRLRIAIDKNPSILKMNYPGTKMTYYEVLKSYERELNFYPNANVIYEKIENEFSLNNHDYIAVSKNIEAIKNEARESYDKMMRYYDNEEVAKMIIKDRITNEYNNHIRFVDSRKQKIVKKNEKLNIKLKQLENDYAKFLLSYESLYETVYSRRSTR